MKKVEKFLKHISKLETGSAPSVEYFEQIILEAREALEEFEKLRQPPVINNEVAVCDKCLGRGSIIIYDTCLDCEKCKGSGTQTVL